MQSRTRGAAGRLAGAAGRRGGGTQGAAAGWQRAALLAALLLALALPPAVCQQAAAVIDAVVPGLNDAPPAPPSLPPMPMFVVGSDANSQLYTGSDAAVMGAVPAFDEGPAVAQAPADGVSAWAAGSGGPGSPTVQATNTWSPGRLVEAAVALLFLVLVMFFVLNSTRQVVDSWEVEKSGGELAPLGGRGGGPGQYGALGDSFREGSGLYVPKMGGYSPNSPAIPVGTALKNSRSSGNGMDQWVQDQTNIDPWEQPATQTAVHGRSRR